MAGPTDHDDDEVNATLARFGLPPRVTPPVNGTNGTAKPAHPVDEHGEEIELTGWEPVDLGPILAGDMVTPAPTLFARSDGVMVLYAGKVHSFNGEPEAGKSLCAQLACAQALNAGLNVSYLDFEDSPEAVIGRILALGASRDDIGARCTYHRLDQPFTLEAGVVLGDTVTRRRPDLAVLDGVTEAMILCSLDPTVLRDVAKFWSQLPRLFTRFGATTVLIDHVTKNKETRGRWAIGSEHKLAAVDGAAFGFDVVKPFGRGREGIARVTVTKDRPGYLRQKAVSGTIGMLRITSWPDEHLDASLEPPDGGSDGTWRPTVLMERISRWVEINPRVTGNDIRAAVKGDTGAKALALRLLFNERFFTSEKEGQRVLYSSLIGYREAAETAKPKLHLVDDKPDDDEPAF